MADDVALTGTDGTKAEQLLARSVDDGAALLGKLVRQAIGRLAESPNPLKAKRLLSKEEMATLANQLRDTNIAGNLLGRSRIRLRAQQVERRHGEQRFSERPTDLRIFDEAPIEPLAPKEAVNYFKKLVPKLKVDPAELANVFGREAFTLAVATDEILLGKVQGWIQNAIETGEGVLTWKKDLDGMWDASGTSPRQSNYSEIVFRTNVMDAYNQGSQRELTASEDVFPVWQYSNPDDGRSRDHHAELNGKYFPVSVMFSEVRGTDIKDVAQCRCVPVPVDVFEWEELQAAGARLERGYSLAA